jgi:hypothetical protein
MRFVHESVWFRIEERLCQKVDLITATTAKWPDRIGWPDELKGNCVKKFTLIEVKLCQKVHLARIANFLRVERHRRPSDLEPLDWRRVEQQFRRRTISRFDELDLDVGGGWDAVNVLNCDENGLSESGILRRSIILTFGKFLRPLKDRGRRLGS